MSVASFHLARFPARRSLSRLAVLQAERWEVSSADGCVLGKVMGTSKEATTKTSVDIRRWALFAVWKNAEKRDSFLAQSDLMRRWRRGAVDLRGFGLEPLSSHGQWAGRDPFGDLTETRRDDQSIAVLTRAKVRWPKVWTFTRAVPPVDEALSRHEGCSLALGMGEWPFGEQATFSIWDSAQSLRAFAYESEEHQKVIARRADENWYSEELFARFAVTELPNQ